MRSAVKGGNLMGQIPYGYRIENGAAVIIPEEALNKLNDIKKILLGR